jgi:hypothetical protein
MHAGADLRATANLADSNLVQGEGASGPHGDDGLVRRGKQETKHSLQRDKALLCALARLTHGVQLCPHAQGVRS